MLILFVVLVASFWPGLLQSYSLAIAMLGTLLVAPSLVIALIIILALQWRRHHSLDLSELKVLPLLFVVMIVATLIMFDLPTRVTIYLNKASITQACNNKNDASRVGIFRIRSSATTENGLYLVTLQHADGLGPDIVSHGIFCGQPGKDTPYGSARGGYRWVTSDIYYFFVSNDY